MLTMHEVIQEDSLAKRAHCFNLDFLEEPSEKPTTDLSEVQMDGKASIRQSLQHKVISTAC